MSRFVRSGTMSGWHNVWLTKCLVVKMSGCQNVGCQSVPVSKCQVSKCQQGLGSSQKGQAGVIIPVCRVSWHCHLLAHRVRGRVIKKRSWRSLSTVCGVKTFTSLSNTFLARSGSGSAWGSQSSAVASKGSKAPGRGIWAACRGSGVAWRDFVDKRLTPHPPPYPLRPKLIIFTLRIFFINILWPQL